MTAQLAVMLALLLSLPVVPQAQAQPAGGAAVAEARYILHAGGITPSGGLGSNSLEALELSYGLGYRVMELDFCWTEDGDLVCVHDWDRYYSWLQPVTMEAFEAVRGSTYGYTSMTLDTVAEWLEARPGAVVVTDIKENNLAGAALIAERYPALRDRFVIQIYHMEEYDPVAALGFAQILTVYQMTWLEKVDTAALAEFAQTHPLAALAFPAELAARDGYVEALLAAGVPLYVHTVNDRAEQAALFGQGISGVYTDFFS
ncbi:MAG: hypothetical protein HFF18_01700 [Oscillospiraceae bacterium]|nr:hypothetical protein [Oscillospiraceae bacterium]